MSQVWERACSRRRYISQSIGRLTLRFREQARSQVDPVSSVGGAVAAHAGFDLRNLRGGTA
ncbi:hypothetical protein CWC48_04565 [Pseudomonas sp. S10E 269]|nr:hypothetical protein CWC49_14725 [Pseudomonas sp. S09F 262]PJK38431.1 hypothetical protein CWC48_04565 [Pseudomonas sp. S10E 269]